MAEVHRLRRENVVGALLSMGAHGQGSSRYVPTVGTEHLALVVHGHALTHIFSDAHLERMFLSLCKLCKAVVACRVSPSQKALVDEKPDLVVSEG